MSEINQPAPEYKIILDRIDQLESRVFQLESDLRKAGPRTVRPVSPGDSEDYIELKVNLPWAGSEEGIERKVGEYGLTWLGNIVLFLGITFLTHFISAQGYPLISFLIGIGVFTGILLSERFLRKNFSYLSFILRMFGQIMLFYSVVRLHFFSAQPVLANKTAEIILLILVIGYQFFESIRRKSEGYAVLAYLMTLCLAILSDTTHIMLPAITAGAILSLFFFNKYQWSRLLTFSVIFSYLVMLLWLVGNPVMGHEFGAIKAHGYSYLYLAVLGATFSMVTLIKKTDGFADAVILSTILLNGLGFSLLLGLMVVTFFATGYIWIFVSIAVFCLGFSALLKFRSPWKYSPALYALYSFVAISITFYGLYGYPHVYLFLTCQSLLVVAVSLWFKSRIIIIMNLLLFLFILAGYLMAPVSLNLTNFSFPVVAFFSARIINWQKERLNIKTEFIRNIYLIVIFITLLYAMYKSVPEQYITLSWAFVAVLYLVISIILKNVKYRYMMFATLVATVMHLIGNDLAKIGMIYRIIAFLVLAVISIGISIYYVRRRTGQ